MGLYTPLVIIRGTQHPAALLVDSVLEIASAPADSWQDLDDGNSFNGCALARVQLGSRTIPVFSAERLLLARERECVAELQALSQRYLDDLEHPQG
jgi:purine-binding chemotaxis protein CheW